MEDKPPHNASHWGLVQHWSQSSKDDVALQMFSFKKTENTQNPTCNLWSSGKHLLTSPRFTIMDMDYGWL